MSLLQACKHIILFVFNSLYLQKFYHIGHNIFLQVYGLKNVVAVFSDEIGVSS